MFLCALYLSFLYAVVCIGVSACMHVCVRNMAGLILNLTALVCKAISG